MDSRRGHHEKRHAVHTMLAQPITHLHAALEACGLDVVERYGEQAHVRGR
jgi:hypothetical protein